MASAFAGNFEQEECDVALFCGAHSHFHTGDVTALSHWTGQFEVLQNSPATQVTERLERLLR